MINTLAEAYPKIAKEWDYDKNDNVTPEKISYGSKKKVWWKCQHGHEYQTSVYSRTGLGTGCPYCSNQKVLQGYNDLLTINPQLASEWDYKKNGSLTPDKVTFHSSKRVWWKCSKGHEWITTVDKRSSGRGCPYCAGKKVLIGYNDLATLYPQIASEWDYEKNGDLIPNHVMPGSVRKVWWKCSKGHDYQATINNRTNNKSGCPYCARRKVLKGFNDLATLYPQIASEWDYKRNGTLTPEQIMPKSNKKVWWICSKGHEWETQPGVRILGSGCPYCNKERQTSFAEQAIYLNYSPRSQQRGE